MSTTIVFTPSGLMRPVRTTSLDIFDLKTLIDDDILAWSNLLSSGSPHVSDSNSPVIWSPDGPNVPLLKPAIPKPYKSPRTDAQILLSFVEETLKEDALKDWEPFAHNDPGRESQHPTTIKTSPVDLGMEKETLTLPPRNFLSTPISTAPAPSKLSDEGIRLSTPVDWKPYHPPDLLYDHKPADDDLTKSSIFALDDCLASQGDTAKARRKRRKRAFEISGDLFTDRNKLLISSDPLSEVDRKRSICLVKFRTPAKLA